MNIGKAIRLELEGMAEDTYRAFSAGLIPGEEHILGVRLPRLREIAKRIVKTDSWQEYLACEPYYFEEIMLQGMIIGAAKIPAEERLEYVRDFIPAIRNWSVCDSFVSGLKFTRNNPEAVWQFIQPYIKSGDVFSVRFAVVMMMNYYLTDSYIDLVLEQLDGIKHEAYYVKMAVAWALATAKHGLICRIIIWMKIPGERLCRNAWSRIGFQRNIKRFCARCDAIWQNRNMCK